MEDIVLKQASTAIIGSAGSSAASRQTYMSGKVINIACQNLDDKLISICAETHGIAIDALSLVNGRIRSVNGTIDLELAMVTTDPIEAEAHYSHFQTKKMDEKTGEKNKEITERHMKERAREMGFI